MTLEQLQAQRQALLAKLAQPKEVSLPDGSRVAYGESSDVRGALDLIDAEIARLQAPPGQSRVFTVTTNRGLK